MSQQTHNTMWARKRIRQSEILASIRTWNICGAVLTHYVRKLPPKPHFALSEDAPFEQAHQHGTLDMLFSMKRKFV
jgi:hypothetical protein